MERTRTNPAEQIPDAINCSVAVDFTRIPNEFLRNPEISLKAKALLCLLLSNKDGWKSHSTTLPSLIKEGREALTSGLNELETFGYLIRVQYQDKRTKRLMGSFWAYTDKPHSFSLQDYIKKLDMINFEPTISSQLKIDDNSYQKQVDDNSYHTTKQVDDKNGFPVNGKPASDSIIYNNIKYISLSPQNKWETRFSDKYLSLARYLYDIISTKKNIQLTSSKIISWAHSIHQLIETNKISEQRVRRALQWYKKNIGAQYVPVIESGSSLKDKFLRLEDAIDRSKNTTQDVRGKPQKKMLDGVWWYLKENGSYYSQDGLKKLGV